ncbi:PREDICTED: embryonic polarity protein dorsal-like, partial [Wasmannia auropunctata]|uniref:embryonic polarity protein dorsal-like n=1 Tax=Wasmannia auropunctata TaxID=64793 RepID=UPI0005EFE2A3
MSDLEICKLSHSSATVAGEMKIILLCEKVAREDIQIRFFEERNEQLLWEGYGDFHPTDVHKQTAIEFKTPRYHTQQVDKPVQMYIQLKRPSDGYTSEPLPFEMLPVGTARPAFWRPRTSLDDVYDDEDLIVMDPNDELSETMSDLEICKLSHWRATVAGGVKMILLCEKVARKDIQIRFFEERNGQLLWEGYGDFEPRDVHKQ